MNDLLGKVSDSELKILKVMWQNGGAMKLRDIRKTLTPLTGWEGVTVKTLLYRLVDKGVVRSEKREAFYFSPLIDELEYNEYATGLFVEKLYDGNVKSLVAALIDGDKLTDADIQELRDMFKVGDKNE